MVMKTILNRMIMIIMMTMMKHRKEGVGKGSSRAVKWVVVPMATALKSDLNYL